MDFNTLFRLANQGLSLLSQAQSVIATVKTNMAGAKEALSETEVTELRAVLDKIHALNMKLSADFDAALAEAEKGG